MKNRFLFICLFITSFCFAQKTIKGTVYEVSGPLEGVAVYLNNSMLGTTTNTDGTFSFPVKEGEYDLIISYLGYKKINYPLNTSTYKKPLVFALVEEENILDEIIIKKTVYDDKWKYNLSTFKRAFIGRTEMAEGCEILNPKVIYFNFDAKNNILTAFARKPLEIRHRSLGYKIIYELEEFVIHKNQVTYLGYSRYKNSKGNKRKQRKWQKNRLKTYSGSFTHFYQTLLKKTTYAEGFLIHLFKRVPNPDRPSEKEIKRARQLIRLSGSQINFSIKIEAPKTMLDSAIITLRKIKLPKFKDQIYKTKAPINDIISKKLNTTYLTFKDNILVVYTKEKEEKGYILRNVFSKMRKASPQSSSIISQRTPTPIDQKGILIRPLDVFYEGYWSYEKFANSLPLDYVPPINMQ
jgi:hypothetical protein